MRTIKVAPEESDRLIPGGSAEYMRRVGAVCCAGADGAVALRGRWVCSLCGEKVKVETPDPGIPKVRLDYSTRTGSQVFLTYPGEGHYQFTTPEEAEALALRLVVAAHEWRRLK